MSETTSRPKFNAVSRGLLFEILFSRIHVRFFMLFLSANAAIFGLLGPFFQKEFIDLLTDDQIILKALPSAFLTLLPSAPLAHLLLAFFSVLISLACLQLVNYIGASEAIHLQRIWSQRLYDKILNLQADTLSGHPIGVIVSIYTTDIPGSTILLEQSLPQALGILFPLLLAPFLVAVLFQTPVGTTLLLMSFIVLLNLAMANRQGRFFYRFKKLAADRIGLVNEWVQNIRTLRILGWVRAFESKIFHIRILETNNRISMLNNGQTMNAIASSITFVLNLSLMLSLIHTAGAPITPGTLLALLWIVAIFLTRPFRQMPWFFTFVFDGISSLNRVSTLFVLANKETQKRDLTFQKLKEQNPTAPIIEVEGLHLEIKTNPVLKDISFSISNGEFVALVGEVGCGKTMLLLSLLGETGAKFKKYSVNSNDAKTLHLDQLRQFFTFVPQEGFIMSASLRENVAFDYDLNLKTDESILSSLKNAEFDLNTERISGGLNTEIGERGVNLSGGQRQRVSLARVDYYRSPIVLLDDCLSAVDVDTERKILDSLLLGAWKKRTRILATHRLTVLEKTDRVFFMENGQIVAVGKFQDLLRTNSKFREYAISVTNRPVLNNSSEVINDPIPAGEK